MTLYFIRKVATDKDHVHKLVIFFLIVYISQKHSPSITRMSAVEWHIYNYLNIIYKFTFKLFYLMICFELIYFEFPCVAGAHFPKAGGSFSQSRWLIFPKSVAHFPAVGGSFSRSRWMIFSKSVAHFPKVGGSFFQSQSLILPKSVAHFLKVGGSFSQSRWLIFQQSVPDFQKTWLFFTKSGPIFFGNPLPKRNQI